MHLTAGQQAILNGSSGPYAAQCMRWLVEWGKVMGARRLIPVDNTHVLLPVPNLMARGASPETVTRYVDTLKEACRHRTHSRCLCTVHTSFITLDNLNVPQNNPDQVRLQKEIADMAAEAGYIPTFTCAPYLVGNVPLKGEILAWTESSAVVYANSILGARTTRHGTESAIAASILGLVPEFGVLLEENRKGTLRIEVSADLDSPTDWGALGYFAGKLAGLGIPVFNGVPRPTQDEAKQLCAALATSGGVTMCHIAGVTPEAPTLEAAFHGDVPSKFTKFSNETLRQTYSSLRNHTGDEIDSVILGCPHASIREIAQIAHLLKGRHVVYRNGFYERDWVTRFKTIWLRIARTRTKNFLPSPLQSFQRRVEEVALLIREAFLRGISTRQVGRIVATFTGEPVSAQTVSRLTRSLDAAVEAFHRAPLRDEWAYLFLDGVSLRMRRPGTRKRVQMLVAYGVKADGTRQLLAFLRSPGESQHDWEGLLRDFSSAAWREAGCR